MLIEFVFHNMTMLIILNGGRSVTDELKLVNDGAEACYMFCDVEH